MDCSSLLLKAVLRVGASIVLQRKMMVSILINARDAVFFSAGVPIATVLSHKIQDQTFSLVNSTGAVE